MTLLERFLSYVNIPTASDEHSSTVPTAEHEFVLAHRLAADMQAIGIADAHVDEHCYVYGHIPATPGHENCPRIGFIAHLDTSPDFADGPMNVQIHEHYDGPHRSFQRRLPPEGMDGIGPPFRAQVQTRKPPDIRCLPRCRHDVVLGEGDR